VISNLVNKPGMAPNQSRRLNMTKKRWILAVGLVALGIVGFSVVSNAGRHSLERMALGHMYRMNMLCEELGITEDQRVALKKLFKEHRKDLQPLAEDVMAKGRALRELILEETPDHAAIRQVSADLGNAIADMAIQASLLAKEARSILTPEQIARFKEMRRHRQKVFDETLREWREQRQAF
jgi:Spy/CpxP family protein refolding chaperone